jgi:DNA-directed RNA polymerase specialized sigma24 family protein
MAPQVPELVEHLFRRVAGRMVAALTRVLGAENLSLAEDVVQESLVQALRTWPFRGVPENPGGWLMQVAKNRALDLLRRGRRRVSGRLWRWRARSRCGGGCRNGWGGSSKPWKRRDRIPDETRKASRQEEP